MRSIPYWVGVVILNWLSEHFYDLWPGRGSDEDQILDCLLGFQEANEEALKLLLSLEHSKYLRIVIKHSNCKFQAGFYLDLGIIWSEYCKFQARFYLDLGITLSE